MTNAEIKAIYEEIVKNGVYDEKYANSLRPEIIDGKMHGICLHFSNELIKRLNQEGILATLVSTLNSDGYLHAAVLYEVDGERKCYIADPVTDIKSGIERNDDELSWRREIEEYVEEFGKMSVYELNSLSEFTPDMFNEDEIRQKLEDVFLKNRRDCTILSCITDVKEYADGPTKLACSTLYEKGIATFCSNYSAYKEISINCYYNSLSDKNKRILAKAMTENPDKYFVSNNKGMYAHLERNDEIKDDYPMQLTFGLSNLSTDLTQNKLAEMMNDLAEVFEKQTYMEGVYTREEVLRNKHNLLDTNRAICGIRECCSTLKDENKKIATNENLVYSEKYDMFFKDHIAKSRYLESLYRKENDQRNESQIALDAEIFYSDSAHMFFEDEKEATLWVNKKLQQEEYAVSTADIALATKETVGEKFIRKIKEIFNRNKNHGNIGGR